MDIFAYKKLSDLYAWYIESSDKVTDITHTTKCLIELLELASRSAWLVGAPTQFGGAYSKNNFTKVANPFSRLFRY